MKIFKSLVVGLVVFGLNTAVFSAEEGFSPYSGTTRDDFNQGGKFDLGTDEGLENFKDHNQYKSKIKKITSSFTTNIADDFIKNNQKNIGINNNEIKALKTIENTYKYSDSSEINSDFLSNELLSDNQKQSVKQLNKFSIGKTKLGDLVQEFESYSTRVDLFNDSTNAINKTLETVGDIDENSINSYISESRIRDDIQKVNKESKVSLSPGQIASKNAEPLYEASKSGWSIARSAFLNTKRLQQLTKIKNIAKFKKLENDVLVVELMTKVGQALYANSKNKPEDMAGNLGGALDIVIGELKEAKYNIPGSKFHSIFIDAIKMLKDSDDLRKLEKINISTFGKEATNQVKILKTEIQNKISGGIHSLMAGMAKDSPVEDLAAVAGEISQLYNKSIELGNKYVAEASLEDAKTANKVFDKALSKMNNVQNLFKNNLGETILDNPNLEAELGWKKAEKPIAKKDSEEEKQAKKEKALNAKNEILAKNKEKQEAKQKQENAKKLAEQTKEVAKLKKAIQTAENLREENAELAEQYANNPTKANKDALDKSGKAFANARDNVSEYDNGEYAQTHKYENSFTVDKDRQVKQNFDTALGDMSQKQKDILARADYDSDNFAEGVIGREQAGRDYTQEQADFYALGGGEDKLKNEKDLASLEDFFDKLLKDDDLADVNDDEKTKVGDNENNNELRSIRGSFSYIGIHQNGGDTYSVGSLETRDNNNTFDSMEYLDFSNSGISGGYPAIAPSTTSEASPDVDGYKYTAWGDWSLSGLVADIGGQDYAVDYGHYVMGNTTIDMPSFGNATYNGKLIGGTVGISNNGVVEKNSIGGTIEIGVNFNNSSLSAVLNSTKNNSNWAVARFSNISVQEGGNFHTGFNGTVDGGGVSRIDGKFFGTNAQEVGGSFQISKTGSDADNATGVFRAKQ
jgi:hypothetical protein